MNATWTEAEKRYIRDNAHLQKDWELAETISRVRGTPVSEAAVRQVRQRMGIKKAQGRGLCQVLTRPPSGGSMGLCIQATPAPILPVAPTSRVHTPLS